jgi:protein-S-isoprenylcysteine O-methyltransferase Ste14
MLTLAQWMAPFSLALFIALLVMQEIGRRLGERRRARNPENAAGLGAIEGAIFALMGLMVAFTFSGAASRIEVRRNLIVTEANTIGTAYLRLDLLPVSAQPALREDFRQYVDSRLAVYRAIPDVPAAYARLADSAAIQKRIWSRAVAACGKDANETTSLVLSPLNEMIDITTTRTVAILTHPPGIVIVMLVLLVLAGALLAGFGSSASPRSWVHTIGFAALMAGAIYLILDLEFPRAGLIRIDALDQLLADVRQSMN